MNGLFLSVVSCLVFVLLGLTCSRGFFPDADRPAGHCGLRRRLYVHRQRPVRRNVLQITFDRVLQATGRTVYTLFTQAVGAVINIILDPILIFGLFGLPRWRWRGRRPGHGDGPVHRRRTSLWSSTLTRNHDVQFRFRTDSARTGASSARIYGVGIPSIVMSSIGSVMVFGMNKILISFTTTATAVFGIYFKLQSFIFMPVFGLNNGMVPIVAYNYGAGRPDRIKQTIKLSVTAAVSIMFIDLLVFQFLPPKSCWIRSVRTGHRRSAVHRCPLPCGSSP